jgi:methylated-DNA-[protein]-cysteine S-methyltransferase
MPATLSPTEQTILDGRLQQSMNFDQRVWAICARIPRGRVTTYGRIAAALGRPGAARAVGGALNRNPLAPDVPCHRVVGHDGALTGFASGVENKRAMLQAEGIAVVGDRVVPLSPFEFE